VARVDFHLKCRALLSDCNKELNVSTKEVELCFAQFTQNPFSGSLIVRRRETDICGKADISNIAKILVAKKPKMQKTEVRVVSTLLLVKIPT
jgi:hypothetical protein